jgi:hypothetical protein
MSFRSTITSHHDLGAQLTHALDAAMNVTGAPPVRKPKGQYVRHDEQPLVWPPTGHPAGV